jgi:undecaprenyl-diphosphatase
MMTLFQAVVTAVIGAFAEIFPIAPGAHWSLLEYFFGWNSGHPRLQGAVQLGVFAALLVYLRHDVLSQVSSLLQVVIYRKKPRAMDERMPLFVVIAVVFPIVAFLFFRRMPINPSEEPFLFAAVFGLSGIPMAFLDSYTKKNKSIYDWNFLDAALVGLGSATVALPEVGRATGAFTLSAMRNFGREGAAKFILYIATPVIGLSAWYHLEGPGATFAVGEFSLLYFYVTLVVSFLAALFAISAFLSGMAKTSLTRFAVYRVLLAAAVIAVHFLRARGTL